MALTFYCVVQEYYDNGKVYAWITNHVSADGSIPPNIAKECKDKDVYWDYFTDKNEAIKFCDETKEV